ELPLAVPEFTPDSLGPSDYAQLEVSLYLQNQLLRDADIFGMAHSLEIRVPFLDHRLVELVFALPDSLKSAETVNKPLLVSALGGDLPSETVTRRKMGFTFPFERWMRQFQTDIVRHTENAGTTQAVETKVIMDSFVKGRIHWSRFWAVSVIRGMSKQDHLPQLPRQVGPKRILLLLP